MLRLMMIYLRQMVVDRADGWLDFDEKQAELEGIEDVQVCSAP